MKYGYKLLQNNSDMAVEEARGKGYMPPQYDPTTHNMTRGGTTPLIIEVLQTSQLAFN